MGRFVLIPTVLALAAAGSTAALASAADERRAGGVTPRSGPAAVQLLSCSQGRARADRWALFRGVMRQLPDGELMQMRFALEQRVARGPYESVPAPGLGVWHEARPGVERFAYRQRVVALARATAYRAVVHFRWYDAAGERTAIASRRSRPCRERGRLANLVAGRLAGPVSGPAPGTARYRARIANFGRALARGVEIALSVDGVDVDVRKLRFLRRGERRAVRLLGPPCAERAEVRIDPADTVPESSELDNAVAIVCSPETTASARPR
jgi:hypothetical protein